MTDKAVTDEGQARLPRVVVDFKLPLPWLIGGALVIAWGLISMFFKLSAVSENVDELKATVKASTAVTTQFAGEQALIKYRVEKLEAAAAGGAGTTRATR
ncbi:MAG TPA: hypothetical protein VD932_06715 [Aquabacterium sp.]|nr:hypothetical protein [Aquabacterium sp.]